MVLEVAMGSSCSRKDFFYCRSSVPEIEGKASRLSIVVPELELEIPGVAEVQMQVVVQ